MFFKPLPWEYGIRNLFRRPVRTALTLAALTIVILLVIVVVGFIRGLERSLAVSGDRDVALVYALGMGENLEYSSIDASAADLLPANVVTIRRRFGKAYASPELYLGTLVDVGPKKTGDKPSMGLIRGVSSSALLVHRRFEIVAGTWPDYNEVVVGKLAATKLGVPDNQLAIGNTIRFENRNWRISGIFTDGGSVFESEMWCRLEDLQQAMQRKDLSLVAVTVQPGSDGSGFGDVQTFCSKWQNLKLQASRQKDYYDRLRKDYAPVRGLAWLIVGLVASAGAIAGLNTMYAAVLGRAAELATLQTIGFSRRAIVVSLIQEGTLLAAAASLLAALLAIVFLQGLTVRFTMSAFELQIDRVAILTGCATGLILGIIGSAPAALRVLRMPVVLALKTV